MKATDDALPNSVVEDVGIDVEDVVVAGVTSMAEVRPPLALTNGETFAWEIKGVEMDTGDLVVAEVGFVVKVDAAPALWYDVLIS